MSINSKSIARIGAIQVLYQFANADNQGNIETILFGIQEFYKDSDFKSDHDIDKKSRLKLKPSKSHLEQLVKHSHENLTEIDDIIKKYLTKDINLTAIPVLLCSILRVAICEIKYFPETPKKVVLNEYTDIASNMLDEHEVGFVNSLLENYYNSKHN